MHSGINQASSSGKSNIMKKPEGEIFYGKTQSINTKSKYQGTQTMDLKLSRVSSKLFHFRFVRAGNNVNLGSLSVPSELHHETIHFPYDR